MDGLISPELHIVIQVSIPKLTKQTYKQVCVELFWFLWRDYEPPVLLLSKTHEINS